MEALTIERQQSMSTYQIEVYELLELIASSHYGKVRIDEIPGDLQDALPICRADLLVHVAMSGKLPGYDSHFDNVECASLTTKGEAVLARHRLDAKRKDKAAAKPQATSVAPPATKTEQGETKVFISYAHSSPEHKQTVTSLVETLRKMHLAVTVDTDVKTPQGPKEGWPRWMKRQIRDADWVLMFFDELYRRRFDGDEEPDSGLGATWEGAIITHRFYRDATRNEKFIPLLADGASSDLIPDEFFGYTRYSIPTQVGELAAKLPHTNGIRPR